MESVKKWLSNRKRESLGAIIVKPSCQVVSMDIQEPVQSDYELTSIKLKHLLEKKRFQKVLDLLNELSRDYVINCLKSFPFILLNKTTPSSFFIWEMLLTKLKSAEEDYIPQFPYKACDQLVMRVAWLLEANKVGRTKEACRRVLKCVYTQYKEVLEQLHKEHDHVDHALHILSFRTPFSSGGLCSIVSIRQAFKDEIEASLEDYTTALDSLNDLERCDNQSHIDSDEGNMHWLLPGRGGVAGHEDGSVYGEGNLGDSGELAARKMDRILTPSCTKLQLHKKLHQNQRVFTALQEDRCSDTLPQMVEFLKERIHQDKEVIDLIEKIQDGNATVDMCVPLQPWLLKYQHALDLAITVLKDVKKDLETSVPRVNSSMQLEAVTVAGDDEVIKMVPVSSGRPCKKSIEDKKLYHRHSTAPILDYLTTEEVENHVIRGMCVPRRNRTVPTHRARSLSPHKLLHVNGHMKYVHSTSNGRSRTNLATGVSSSAADLLKTSEYSPILPFSRVQSLKTCNSILVADQNSNDMCLLPNSFTNHNSISTGNVNAHHGRGKKAKKTLHGSGSELGQTWATQVQVNNDRMCDEKTLLQQALEHKDEELTAVHKLVQELRRREKELTDRLAEQAQQHLQDCEKFEDILLGNNRPTQVVQTFNELYSQGRLEALDELEMTAAATTSHKHFSNTSSNTCSVDAGFSTYLLLDVLTLSYKEAARALEQLHENWKDVLGMDANALQDCVAGRQLKSSVALYLCRVSSQHNTASITKNVWVQLSLKYSESEIYQAVYVTPAFSGYVRECVKMSWRLCVQTPPMTLNYSETKFNLDLHTRFFESDMSSSNVLHYHWPALLHTSSGPILARGIVQT